METKLIDTKSGDLLWTATTRTYDPTDADTSVDGLVKVLIKDLQQRRLI
jgi:hypothetical protein